MLVAIDPVRHLNNGEPGFLAFLIDALELKAGERVAHIGCGTGYYSAILAEVVGKKGRVIAVEIDQKLAARAKRNLSPWRQVSVMRLGLCWSRRSERTEFCVPDWKAALSWRLARLLRAPSHGKIPTPLMNRAE